MTSTDQNEPLPAKSSTVAQQQEMIFARSSLSRRLVEEVPLPLLVINQKWQVVYANRATLETFSRHHRKHHYGLQPGESFHCLHASKQRPSGGSGKQCQICGVAQAVSLALKGQGTTNDCRMSCELAEGGSPLELRVRATPLDIDGEHFSILMMSNVSQEKRRAMLANACFHDLLNTLTGIRGLLDVLKHSAETVELPEICELLEQMTLCSIEEIMTLRLLEQAEESQLSICHQKMRSGSFLTQVVQAMSRHPAAKGKRLDCDPALCDEPLLSDPTLMRRLLANMILNALEATNEGGMVGVGCRGHGEELEFWVHNDHVIPPELQSQIFSRSFSTKGDGRGFGTFSIQLIGTLLGGRVGFSSKPGAGTTFFSILPKQPPLHNQWSPDTGTLP